LLGLRRFAFLEVSLLVNANRVKQKLPGLLVNGKTSKKKNHSDFYKKRYRLQQLNKRNPEKSDTLLNKLCAVLVEIEEAAEQTVNP